MATRTRGTVAGKTDSSADETTITGRIICVIFQRDGFLIANLDSRETVLGEMKNPSSAVAYEFHGRWKTNAKYGRQFAFESYSSLAPKDPDAVAVYLRENCRWIGPQVARAIATRYGPGALAVCKNDPKRLAAEINGITIDRAQEIAQKLVEIEKDEALQIELKKIFLDIPVQKRALKQIAEEWGNDAPQMIEADPYVLPDMISGIGFPTADLVAQKFNIRPDDNRRVRGAVIHIMKESVSNHGHTHLPLDNLVAEAWDLTACDKNIIHDMIRLCVESGRLVREDRNVYLPQIWEAERYVVEKITKLATTTQRPAAPVLTDLADDQIEAVTQCLKSSVSVMTGPAGSGKSFAVKRVIDSLRESGSGKVALAAPTGKAAKRMFEHTNYVAQTIHRLLEPERVAKSRGKLAFEFSRDEDNPIESQTLVLDETSMLDLALFASTLRALAPEARLILIGDPNQLPAIGAGNVLHDLIRSGAVPVSRLTTIKRQNPGLLLRNAHAVIAGDQITVENENPNGDFYFISSSDQQNIQNQVCELVAKRLPSRYGFDRIRDIQVLSPFREKTILSCKALNARLQDVLNATGKPIGKTAFRQGDKVIQKRNDYERGIVNGDIGTILDEEIDGNKFAWIRIMFESPEREVVVPMYDNDIHLAYTLTVHSYQGSESPAVIIPIHTSFGSLIMQRSWIYTAITRAKSLCVIVGEPKVFRAAVRRNRQINRNTMLAEKLRAAVDANTKSVESKATGE